MRSAKIAKHKILIIPLSLMAVTLMAGYFLSHIPLGANATTSDVSLRVKDTCTMDGNVTTDDSNMLNGQEREGFHVLSLTTYCNDNAGFSIYAVGYSGDLEGNTDLTGVTTGLTISTADWADRNTGDNAAKSIYSLKIEKDNTSYLPGNISILNGFTNYLAVPSTNTKVASYSSNTDTTTGSTINASYAVKVANLQAADTYTGKVKYTMVHPSSNTATGFTFDDAFQLAGKTRVSGTSYFAMQDMNAAICNKVTTPLTTDAASTPQAQLIDIRDNKVYWVAKLMDGKCWMTQNLDLDLGSVALNSDNTNINPNTPVNSDTGYSLVDNKITWTPTRSTIDSTGYGDITTCSSQSDTGTGCWGQTNTGFTSTSGNDLWDNDNNTPYSVNPGYRYMVPKILDTPNPDNQWYANGDTFANCSTLDTNCGGQGHYMIGNYYNFAAANATNSVAGTVGHTVTDSDADYVMPNSICPKGWRMPLGQSNNNDFTTLFTAYNIYGDGAAAFNYEGLNAIRRDPLYFVRSGYVGGSTLNGAGTFSYVWSNTISAASRGRGLYFYGTGLNPALSDYRLYGFAVRCIVDDSMQSFTTDATASLAINESLTLRDTRDNQEYTVAKLRDGKVWMTKNLNFAGGATITSEDTDMAPGYTMPTTYVDPDSGATLPTGFGEGNVLPASSKTGFDNDYKAFIYNTGNNTDICTGDGCYSYYSYNAATLGSGMDISSDNTDAPYSVCPKGWRLPTSRTTVELAAGTPGSDFYKMAINYGLNPADVNEPSDTDPNFCDLGGDCSTNTVPRFLRAGYYRGSTFNAGGLSGSYWSSTASSSTTVPYLHFYSGYIYSAHIYYRGGGFSIRCLLRTE
ncbi:hypothetical protein IJG29_02050 [Candidatus Saccharibacteria bacterium]|nr:hypothetical protein [Candidatus Saccharibacteria bacterium]